jgi:hypothetical protein
MILWVMSYTMPAMQNKIWRFGAVVLYPSEHRPVVAAV